jgi:hypothetical protein
VETEVTVRSGIGHACCLDESFDESSDETATLGDV